MADLSKLKVGGTTYNLKDATARGAMIPNGGSAGQVLAKKTGTDYDTEWVDVSGGGGSSTLLLVPEYIGKQYAVGDVVTRSSDWYKCTSPTTSGAWDSSKWSRIIPPPVTANQWIWCEYNKYYLYNGTLYLCIKSAGGTFNPSDTTLLQEVPYAAYDTSPLEFGSIAINRSNSGETTVNYGTLVRSMITTAYTNDNNFELWVVVLVNGHHYLCKEISQSGSVKYYKTIGSCHYFNSIDSKYYSEDFSLDFHIDCSTGYVTSDGVDYDFYTIVNAASEIFTVGGGGGGGSFSEAYFEANSSSYSSEVSIATQPPTDAEIIDALKGGTLGLILMCYDFMNVYSVQRVTFMLSAWMLLNQHEGRECYKVAELEDVYASTQDLEGMTLIFHILSNSQRAVGIKAVKSNGNWNLSWI